MVCRFGPFRLYNMKQFTISRKCNTVINVTFHVRGAITGYKIKAELHLGFDSYFWVCDQINAHTTVVF